MHQPAWLFPSLLSSAPLTPKGSTPGTSPPHPHLPDPFHASTHPHSTSNITLPLRNSTNHDHTFPALLLSCAGWYGTPWWRRTREDKSGILVKWSGGGYDSAFQLPRFLFHSPTSSPTHKDALHTSLQGTVTPKQLHSAHRWIHHPFLPLPLPPPGGWVPLLQREGGKGYMCVWEGQDWFGIDIRQVGIARHENRTTVQTRPTGLQGCSGGGLTRRAGPSRVTTYTST